MYVPKPPITIGGLLGQVSYARPAEKEPKLIQVPVDLIDPWEDEDGNHQPFDPYTQEMLEDMAGSIQDCGIIDPIRLRPRPNGRFQLIAGENRWRGTKLAGQTTILAIVEDMDNNRAGIMMVDSNLRRRSEVPPSVKAKAYQERLGYMERRVGRPSKENSSQVGANLPGGKSVDILAKKGGSSARQVQRYLALNHLHKTLLALVDSKDIGLTVGEKLSHLPPDTQALLVSVMEDNGIQQVSASQADELRAIENPTADDMLRVLGIAQTGSGKEPEKKPANKPVGVSLTIKQDLSGYEPGVAKKLKKNPKYMEGLQSVIADYTSRFIRENKEL